MFCPRQWALIHIDQVWNENQYTAEGQLLHKHVDDPFYRQTQAGKRTLRKLSIASKRLGLYGYADIVECESVGDKQNDTISLNNCEGFWRPIPIEYKRGKPKDNICDIIQVVAQAMCLEEMFSINVNQGAIYYAAIKRRLTIDITNTLRQQATEVSARMHEMMSSGTIPSATFTPKCLKCSLIDICIPKSFKHVSVKSYLKNNLYSDEET